MHILIRCDASLLIGSGHVMRCRTLARELQRCGATVTFLCRRQLGDLIGLLEQEFSVLALPEQDLAPCNGLQGSDLHRAWLGCSQDQDAAQCMEALADAGISSASWLVTDHYGLDSTWESQLLSALAEGNVLPRLFVIDDLADRPHKANLLLDQNFFGEDTEQRYQRLVPRQCLQLLGPHYALLGPEYPQLHSLVPSRIELRRLMVFFGGVDQANLTGRTLEVLLDSVLADLSVDVVLGFKSPHRHAVEHLARLRPNTTLHSSLPSLAGLIARADLGIGAGGITTWERACLGLPALVVPCAANQIGGVQALEKENCIINMSTEKFEKALCNSLDKVVSDQAWLYSASTKSADLADGHGTDRVLKYMFERNC